MLEKYDFLTLEENDRTCQIVYQLKEYWISRGGGFVPFYTLGAASYLDAAHDNLEAYLQAAGRTNPILESYFPLLYERLIETLSNILNMPVAYAAGLGLPGFHIFLSSKVFENPIAAVHFDKQYQLLKWNYEEIDFDHPISFTCALAMPEKGSGLNYWDISSHEAEGLSSSELKALKEEKETLFFPYELGKLVLHRELILHQIAPTKEIKEGDKRITLQGHGIICDGIMRLYW